jgi:hypothetical protein
VSERERERDERNEDGLGLKGIQY